MCTPKKYTYRAKDMVLWVTMLSKHKEPSLMVTTHAGKRQACTVMAGRRRQVDVWGSLVSLSTQIYDPQVQ